MSAASTLAHEIREQNAKQKDGISTWKDAHKHGIRAEYNVTGYLRNQAEETSHGSYNARGEYSGTLYETYYKATPVGFWGKSYVQKAEVTVTIVNGNITNVQEQ